MKFIFSILLIGLFGYFSTSCTKKSAQTERVFHFGNGAEPKDLDPHQLTGFTEFNVSSTVFEGLINLDPKTSKPIDGVAILPPKVSADGLVYTFTLRKNAKWSNGDTLTAHDFVYGWRRVVNPKTACPYADMIYPVKNAQAIHQGKEKDITSLGVKALGDYTLQVTLGSPTPYFLSTLYFPTLYPIHKTTVEKHKEKWTRPENFVGNGPFLMKEWQVNKVIRMRKNPHYWDKDTVKLDGVDFWPIENASTEEKMFRANKLHRTYSVPIERIPHWQKEGSGTYRQPVSLATYFFKVNIKRSALGNKLVRKALALAIDREQIVKHVLRGGQLPALAFTPPGAGGYQPKKYLPSDGSQVEQAKKLLAKAGYPNGKDFPSFEILYNTNESNKAIAEAVQQMWKQHLSIDVKLFNQEWKVYIARNKQKDFDLSTASWYGDYNDPNTFMDLMVGARVNNVTNWANKEYDELIDKASKLNDQKRRFALFHQAEAILLEELPVIPIYTYTKPYLLKSNVRGWYDNMQDVHPMKFVSLQQPEAKD